MPRKPKVPSAPITGTATSTDVAQVYPTADPVVAPPALHALDLAMIGSKLVGTEQGTVLATPEREVMLVDPDPAARLPKGARIQKIADGVFRSIQLDHVEDKDALITATAYEAVMQFRSHFHGD